MAKYEVATPIEHDGEPKAKGDKIDLNKDQALPLIRSGALLPNNEEEEKQQLAEPVSGDNPRATPAAQTEAEERNIDLADVEGSGPGQQITVNDVKRAAKRG